MAIGVAMIVVLAVAFIKPFVVRRFAASVTKSDTTAKEMLLQLMRATKLGLVALFVISLAAQYLAVSAKAFVLIKGATAIAVFLQAGLWGGAILKVWINRSRTRMLKSDAATATSLTVLGFVAQLVLWVLIVLMTLENLGVNITALVAGLGIGGVAVALAAQNILGDLFASVSMVFDEPFVIGDFVIVDNYMGTIENIGLKTTRIRSLDGEQIVFSNSDLLKARLRNYKRMYERRVAFTFRVPHQATPEQLERIPKTVRQIIESQQKIRFERSHFARINDWSFEIETIYWVLDPDHNLYMDIQQAVNLALMRALAKEKLSFAVPLSTVQVGGPVSVEAKAAPMTNKEKETIAASMQWNAERH